MLWWGAPLSLPPNFHIFRGLSRKVSYALLLSSQIDCHLTEFFLWLFVTMDCALVPDVMFRSLSLLTLELIQISWHGSPKHVIIYRTRYGLQVMQSTSMERLSNLQLLREFWRSAHWCLHWWARYTNYVCTSCWIRLPEYFCWAPFTIWLWYIPNSCCGSSAWIWTQSVEIHPQALNSDTLCSRPLAGHNT